MPYARSASQRHATAFPPASTGAARSVPWYAATPPQNVCYHVMFLEHANMPMSVVGQWGGGGVAPMAGAGKAGWKGEVGGRAEGGIELWQVGARQRLVRGGAVVAGG